MSGPVLVVAGAGSGKTRTIVYRVAWLVEQGVRPESILLLTFTRRAAEEMLSRSAELLDQRIARVAGGTFHSTGNLILRRYAAAIGYDSSFSIMDQGDAVDAIDHIKRSSEAGETGEKGFPKARTLYEVFSHAAGRALSVSEALKKRYPHFERYADVLEDIHAQYKAFKQRNNLMDYDDLLGNTIRVLESDERIRPQVSDRYRYILVDEYQDTNKLQARLLKLLASEHNHVMVVGDDSQSIYSFRGADFHNIMDFPAAFPGARIITLEENYRSTQSILNVTNEIIARAGTGFPKRLFTSRPEGPQPLRARPESERDQSRFVLACIEELHEADVPLGEIAVLFRAGWHAFDLEGELTRSSVPYVKYGGFKFLESLHIKDVLAHLRVIDNPRDTLAWIRVLKILPGVGIKTATKLAGTLTQTGIPREVSDILPRKPKYGQALQTLFDVLSSVDKADTRIADKVGTINEYYFPVLKQQYDNYPKRMRDLEHLADLTAPYQSLRTFLNDMALEPPDTDAAGTGDNRSDTLVLSTIHSAKGLEWHTVILIWATEGRIPSPMASTSPEDLEEERRLIYVAGTRAKHNLVIVSPRKFMDRKLGMVEAQPSRFFEEIAPHYFRGYPV